MSRFGHNLAQGPQRQIDQWGTCAGPAPSRTNLRETLVAYCTNFLTIMLSPEVTALYRLMIAEAQRFPELGRIFHDRGPADATRCLHTCWMRKFPKAALSRTAP